MGRRSREKKVPRGFYLTAEVDNDDTFVALGRGRMGHTRCSGRLLAMSRRYGRSFSLSLSLGRSEQRRSLIPSRPAGTAIFQRLKVREEREGEGATSMALCLSFVDIRATPRSEKPTGASTNDVYKKIHLLPLCQENL